MIPGLEEGPRWYLILWVISTSCIDSIVISVLRCCVGPYELVTFQICVSVVIMDVWPTYHGYILHCNSCRLRSHACVVSSDQGCLGPVNELCKAWIRMMFKLVPCQFSDLRSQAQASGSTTTAAAICMPSRSTIWGHTRYDTVIDCHTQPFPTDGEDYVGTQPCLSTTLKILISAPKPIV